MPSNAIAPPFFIPDLASILHDDWFPCTDIREPSIGFCGVAAPFKTPWNITKLFDLTRLISTYSSFFGINPERLLRRIGNNTKHAFRTRLILELKKNKLCKTSFVLRSAGGLVTNSYYRTTDDSPYVLDYVNNILDNLYTICCRGTENYSVRFYETMCLGRIPIIVDSDVVLPFDNSIDYHKRCIFIDPLDISKSAEIIASWHYARSRDELIAVQSRNRSLWHSHLSHSSFYSQLLDSLPESSDMGKA